MTIDSHHHLWKYNDRDYVWMNSEMGALRRSFLIPELEEVVRECDVEGTVAVQARQTVEETEWLLGVAGRSTLLLGVVGWIPLVDSQVAKYLERFVNEPKFKGVRHVVHDEPDETYMLRDDFNRGVSLAGEFGLAYDILVFERHLPQTLAFVDRHPRQTLVIDHVAKPRIQDGLLSPWRENITELAKRKNIYCKVSGMATEADWSTWTVETLRPYFETVLSAFGAKRLMFGSDWPVLTLAGGYAKWMSAFRMLIAGLSQDEREDICRNTAISAYRL